MTRRLALSLAAALAVGACSDQDPTGSSSPETALAVSGTKAINVVLKGTITEKQLSELQTYGTVQNQIPKLNAVIMTGEESSLAAIQKLRFVKRANFDVKVNIPPFPQVALSDFTGGFNTWDLDAVNVTNLQAGPDRVVAYDGDGVYVAILDTGLLPTWKSYFPDERIAEEYGISFGGGGAMDRGAVPEQPGKWNKDTHSHGTHVTSTVIGYSLLGTPINGVAPKATIIPVKVLNQDGSGWSSVIAQGIVYVADLKTGPLAGHPVVINMSLGGPGLDAVEQAAIDYAIARGVIIVASAGNAGEGGMGFPGAYAPVISVAASGWVGEWKCGGTAIINSWWNSCQIPDPTNANDYYITDFSSRELAGQELDVAAPGSWVVGPFQVNQGQLSYFFLGGTSMSSPHVAGIAALMLQKNPTLSQAQVQAILKGSAVTLPAGNRNVFDIITNSVVNFSWGANATGEGLVTANAALAATP